MHRQPHDTMPCNGVIKWVTGATSSSTASYGRSVTPIDCETKADLSSTTRLPGTARKPRQGVWNLAAPNVEAAPSSYLLSQWELEDGRGEYFVTSMRDCDRKKSISS